MVKDERDSANCLVCGHCKGPEPCKPKKCGDKPLKCKKGEQEVVKKDGKGCDKCKECEKVPCKKLTCQPPKCQPGEKLKQGNEDKHGCKLCDTCEKIPCTPMDQQKCKKVTCKDKKTVKKSFDKDGCEVCPDSCECLVLSCSKDFTCKPPSKLKKETDQDGCKLCDSCEKPNPRDCDPKKICKIDMEIVELYNSKFDLTRRLSTTMRRLALKRCMNHRQLRTLSK